MSGLKRGRGEANNLETIEDLATLVPYATEDSAARHSDDRTVHA
jgi:hypothetical protein